MCVCVLVTMRLFFLNILHELWMLVTISNVLTHMQRVLMCYGLFAVRSEVQLCVFRENSNQINVSQLYNDDDADSWIRMS